MLRYFPTSRVPASAIVGTTKKLSCEKGVEIGHADFQRVVVVVERVGVTGGGEDVRSMVSQKKQLRPLKRASPPHPPPIFLSTTSETLPLNPSSLLHGLPVGTSPSASPTSPSSVNPASSPSLIPLPSKSSLPTSLSTSTSVPALSSSSLLHIVSQYLPHIFPSTDLFWSINGIAAPDLTLVYVPENCHLQDPIHFQYTRRSPQHPPFRHHVPFQSEGPRHARERRTCF
ncbi:hypothetical protein V8G54_032165 [Vigna mungo]|uniref:Uncharacterized protein n=1 Tax=Vigna mungo TaxID=3915 RepID=A0AAQ3MKZ4_VIGMU